MCCILGGWHLQSPLKDVAGKLAIDFLKKVGLSCQELAPAPSEKRDFANLQQFAG